RGLDILGIELTAPEAVEGKVVISAEDAVPLGVGHAGIHRAGPVRLRGSCQRQALLIGETAGIHVGIAHAPPMVRVARLDRALERGDVQRVGTPQKLQIVVGLESIGPRLGDEGVGADIVAPQYHLGHAALPSRRHIHQKAKPTTTTSSTTTRISMADSWIQATAGTDTARKTPTRQMRQTRAWRPATKVPSASRISSPRLAALSLTTPRTSGRNISHIATRKASQCSAWVMMSRK